MIAQCQRCGVFGTSEHQCVVREATAATSPQLEPLPFVGHRRDPRELGDAARDCELLAKHIAALVGNAMNPEPRVASGRILDGRPDHIDDKNNELHDAIRVVRRLGLLTPAHRAVILYAFLLNGDESRERMRVLDGRIGLVFATKPQRMKWLLNPARSMGAGASIYYGKQLREAALSAYASLKTDDDSKIKWSIVGECDALREVEEDALQESKTLVRTRNQNQFDSRADRRWHGRAPAEVQRACVYFIQAGENGPIKIGTTTDLQKRVAMLSTGSPVQLLIIGSVSGGRAEEIELHKRFKHLRMNREWFSPGQELLDYIAQTCRLPETAATADGGDVDGRSGNSP